MNSANMPRMTSPAMLRRIWEKYWRLNECRDSSYWGISVCPTANVALSAKAMPAGARGSGVVASIVPLRADPAWLTTPVGDPVRQLGRRHGARNTVALRQFATHLQQFFAVFH